MSRRYFGTDGVRGTIGTVPMTADFVLRLGYAAGRVLLSQHRQGSQERPTALIGKDTRVSGYMLEAALEAGFSAAGVNVLLCGPLPTPAVAYLTRALRVAAGVVISASHNPYPDNGIKFFSADGSKLPDTFELEVERLLEQPMGCESAQSLGRARRINDAAGRYIEFCKSTIPASLDLHGLKIVIDCAHGAAYHIAPHVLHELGAEVHAIGVQPDGYNINRECGATHPEALVSAVREHHADLGIALDGDADRVLMSDATGKVFDGDALLYALVRHRLTQGPVAGVVGTLMSNLALEQVFARLNVPFERAPVGDRYVLERLRARGWLFGGENSGHLLCLDKHTTGDGLVSALQVLVAMREGAATLAALTADLVLYPQVLINVPVASGFDHTKFSAIAQVQSEVERSLGARGRVLLRASGTEPLLRVMVEGADETEIRACAEKIAAVVRRAAQSQGH